MIRGSGNHASRTCVAAFAYGLASVFPTGCDEGKPASHVVPISVQAQSAAPWFEEISLRARLHFTHDSGHRTEFYLPESVCGGAALFDMDSDGLLDVYIVQAGHIPDLPEDRPSNRLYRNRGDGTFDDVTDASGADDRGVGMGVAVGDYNNDGLPDLYITNVGPNVLLRNDGNGKFSDVTADAGVGHAGLSAGAAFVDFDRDGHLDLFVANYIHWSVDSEQYCTVSGGHRDYCNPRAYRASSADALYRNNGDGTFTDVSVAAGIADAPGNGLGVVCGDFNSDGLIDIYVANDGTRNRLWMNLGNGRFADRAMELGCAIDEAGIEKAGMGVIASDLDGDSDLDLMVVNLVLETDSVFQNERDYFIDVTASVGMAAVSRRYTRFGLGLHDFNNDGHLDVYQANGKINRMPPFWSDDLYAEPNLLMMGTETGRFEEVPQGGVSVPLIATSRAAVFGDVDNDGGVDVLVINRDGSPHLLRNRISNQGHWLMSRVLDEHNRDALGATVIVTIGQRRIYRDVQGAYGYLAANDPRVHFGLGVHAHVADVSVRWIDGVIESFGPFNADQILMLRRGAGTPQESSTGLSEGGRLPKPASTGRFENEPVKWPDLARIN